MTFFIQGPIAKFCASSLTIFWLRAWHSQIRFLIFSSSIDIYNLLLEFLYRINQMLPGLLIKYLTYRVVLGMVVKLIGLWW